MSAIARAFADTRDRSKLATEVRARIAYYSAAELVEDGMHLAGDLALDSLDRWQLLVDIESRFGISVGDREWLSASSVGDVIRLVEEKCR